MAPTLATIGNRLSLGEGPHWDVKTQTLYFVDLFGGKINRYVPATGKHTQATIGEHASFIIPVEGTKDKFVAAVRRAIVLVTWDGVSEQVSATEKLYELEDETDTLQFNDAKADSSGRLWLGTLSFEKGTKKWVAEKGALYSFGSGKVLTKQFGNVTISNGLTFNAAYNKFYYIDSPQRQVYQFDFDAKLGKIYNRETIFTLDKHDIPGMPDGQTIDTDGNLWVAVFDAGRVIKIDPRRPETLLQTLEIPAKQTTSVAFGGPNLDELYVTTGNVAFDEAAGAPDDEGSGFTYVVKGLGVRGLPAENFRL